MILLFVKYTVHVSSFITLSLLAIIFTTYIVVKWNNPVQIPEGSFIVNNSPGENVCLSPISRRNETSSKCAA